MREKRENSILDLGIRCGWLASRPGRFTSGIKPPVTGKEEAQYLFPFGNSIMAVQAVAIPTEPSRILVLISVKGRAGMYFSRSYYLRPTSYRAHTFSANEDPCIGNVITSANLRRIDPLYTTI
jgi:hypothetical protein